MRWWALSAGPRLDDAQGVIGALVQVVPDLLEDVLRHVVGRVRGYHVCVCASSKWQPLVVCGEREPGVACEVRVVSGVRCHDVCAEVAASLISVRRA